MHATNCKKRDKPGISFMTICISITLIRLQRETNMPIIYICIVIAAGLS